MRKQFLGVFAFAFVVELAAAGYTLALTSGNVGAAIACSVMVASLSKVCVLSYVSNHRLIISDIAGEVLGTFVAMGLAAWGH